MERLVTGQFQEQYVATIGKEEYSLVASTNRGRIKFKMVDIPGQEKTGPLKDQYYENADGAFLMFDLTSSTTYSGKSGAKFLYNDMEKWCRERKGRDILPVVLIGNMVDMQKERKIKGTSIKLHTQKQKMIYYEMSNKTNINLEEPFLWMARTLLNDYQLELFGLPEAIEEEEAADLEHEMDFD
jgi:GTP-binding nuclear protein Ran